VRPIFVPYRTIRKGGASIEDVQDGRDSRAQQTRERIRVAARRLFLQQGYQATSMDAIRVTAGVASKETLYRHYPSKEKLFIDVMGHLTMEQPGFSAMVAALPAPGDLPSLRQALTTLAREILALMTQPDYLPLLRILIAETARFPELGPLFFAAIPQRGLGIITSLLRAAREHGVIAETGVEYEVVARALLGGLLTYAVQGLLAAADGAFASLDRADALVEVILRAVKL
jgi:TetR/AcrR family transcriptional regulator, mexJK operon transcriptional repressor